jgi:hypothetical protein
VALLTEYAVIVGERRSEGESRRTSTSRSLSLMADRTGVASSAEEEAEEQMEDDD